MESHRHRREQYTGEADAGHGWELERAGEAEDPGGRGSSAQSGTHLGLEHEAAKGRC